MNADESQGSNLPERRSDPRKSIRLGNISEIGLEGLPDDVAQQLRADFVKGMIDVNLLAVKYGVETQALAAALRNLSEETVTAIKEGSHITITRTQEDSLGKTEIITGNTETAKRGKLTRVQSGLPDYTLAYIIGAVVVVIILALLLKQ
jgi:hypothetical protein